jgi:hypothetical protein
MRRRIVAGNFLPAHAAPDTVPSPTILRVGPERTLKTPSEAARLARSVRAFKLIESAPTRRWRAVNAPHLVALVRAGAVFTNGTLIERPDGSEGGDQHVA